MAKALSTLRHAPAIRGRLEPHWGFGCQGVVWAVLGDSDGEPRPLGDGDLLTVSDPETGEVVFDGPVRYDHRQGWRPYHGAARHGGQALGEGVWVDGVPAGADPDAWAGMFSRRLDASVVPARHA